MNKTLKAPSIKWIVMSLLCTAIISQTSCNSYKKVPYFQDASRTQITDEQITNNPSFIIQPYDQLSINVGSTNPEAAAVFSNNIQNAGANPANANYGYIVDPQGQVKLPLVGKVKVAGLTTIQLSEQLEQLLLPYLKAPSVAVTVVNFKVAVLGDVLRPNVYSSNSERLTITEALSLAGDLNVTAKREDVLLVREMNGKREYVPIDLNSKTLFQSPYFYLKSNDLIYATPGKSKMGTVTDKGYQNVALIISALSVVAITLSLLK